MGPCRPRARWRRPGFVEGGEVEFLAICWKPAPGRCRGPTNSAAVRGFAGLERRERISPPAMLGHRSRRAAPMTCGPEAPARAEAQALEVGEAVSSLRNQPPACGAGCRPTGSPGDQTCRRIFRPTSSCAAHVAAPDAASSARGHAVGNRTGEERTGPGSCSASVGRAVASLGRLPSMTAVLERTAGQKTSSPGEDLHRQPTAGGGR